ncbi:MAG: tetratricopeptide repeat protein [Dysgonomonas sp.]
MKQAILTISLLLFIALQVYSQEVQKPLADYLSNFQYQKALEYIDSQEPTKDLLKKKALCYKTLGEHRKAIEILQPLSKEYPDEIPIISELAVCYEDIAQRRASAECYDSLIRLDSTNLYFKNQKADILYQLGEYNEALSLFQTVYDQNNSPISLKRMAQCFEKMNMPDSAKVYFKEAWDRNSEDGFSVASLTNICLKQGSVHEAIAYSEKYMETDTTDQQVNLLNALCYYKLDDYEESVNRFGKCYLNGDTSLIVNRSLGISYYSLDKSAETIKHLESAYRMDTTNNNVLFCLAASYSDMAEYEKSIACYKKLLYRTIPENLTLFLYFRNLASDYNRIMDYPNALENYQEALKYANANQKMNTYFILGVLCDNGLKDYKKAIEYYKLYRVSLAEYLKDQESKPDTEPTDIENTKNTIKNLEKRLRELGVTPPK